MREGMFVYLYVYIHTYIYPSIHLIIPKAPHIHMNTQALNLNQPTPHPPKTLKISLTTHTPKLIPNLPNASDYFSFQEDQVNQNP